MKITARTIAEKANVSPATVSLVFRGKPGVGKETREKVLAIANELGFEYNPADTSRPSSTILLIIYKRHGRVVSDTQFFEELTKGVSDATYRHGYHRLSISYFYANENTQEQLKSIRSVKCAGIILLATEALATDIAHFEHLGVPLVLLDNWFPTKSLDCVVIDNARGAWGAVRHLATLNHKRIGYLHCGVSIRNFLERQEGFIAAIRDSDQTKTLAPQIIRVGSTVETAYADMKAFLDSAPDVCDAYFADNDLVAAGCMRALIEAGYKIPEDVSIIGFDDTPLCEVLRPTLTTMAVNKAAMGDLAVHRLVDLINNDTQGETLRISIQPTIVKRESVKDITESE